MDAELEVYGDGDRKVPTDSVGVDSRAMDRRQFMTCGNCGKAYRRVDSLSTHENNLKGDRSNRQVHNKAAHLAMDMVDKSKTGFHTSSALHPSLTGVVVSDAVRAKRS